MRSSSINLPKASRRVTLQNWNISIHLLLQQSYLKPDNDRLSHDWTRHARLRLRGWRLISTPSPRPHTVTSMQRPRHEEARSSEALWQLHCPSPIHSRQHSLFVITAHPQWDTRVDPQPTIRESELVLALFATQGLSRLPICTCRWRRNKRLW